MILPFLAEIPLLIHISQANPTLNYHFSRIAQSVHIKSATSHVLKLPKHFSDKILLFHKHRPVAVNHSLLFQVGARPLLVPSVDDGFIRQSVDVVDLQEQIHSRCVIGDPVFHPHHVGDDDHLPAQ